MSTDPNLDSRNNDQPPVPPELSGFQLRSTPGEEDYGADKLKHLSDLEHVRERPSMYIADTTPAACTTWSMKWLTIRSTRPWPAMPTRSR